MGFEEFDKRMSPLGKNPTVTIQKRGTISLNRPAHKLMGEPVAVVLLYDREARVIGLKPTEEDAPNAYVLRPQVPNNPASTLAVSSLAFTQYYGIDTPVSRRYAPTWDDGILRVDLKSTGVIVRGNRSGRDSEPASDTDA